MQTLTRNYIANYDFYTKNSNDIKIDLILLAESRIDRQRAIKKLMGYINELFIAVEVERGIFEFSLVHVVLFKLDNKFVYSVYMEKLNDICCNLDVNDKHIDNQTLLHNLKNITFNPKFTAFLSPEQMHPKRWADVISKQKMRDEITNNVKTTDIYKCARCGERKFKITEIQMRCADEPANRVCVCLVCYNTFIK